MATTAADPVFVDTNILVFANTATAPFHAEAQAALRSLAASGAELWISRQVLREYLATLSRPQTFTAPVPVATLCADVVRFQAQFRIAEDGPRRRTGNSATRPTDKRRTRRRLARLEGAVSLNGVALFPVDPSAPNSRRVSH